MSAYQKEIRSTLGFSIVYILLGHTGLWVILFGMDNSVRLLGLPVHYLIAIVLGSFGVLIWSIIWCKYANQLEDEIEKENAAVESRGAENTDDATTSSPHTLNAEASA